MKTQTLHWKAAEALRKAIQAQLKEFIDAIVVYGSVARGEATEDSDIDVLIIGSRIHQYEKTIAAIRTEIDIEYGTLTTLIYRTPAQITKDLERGSPFLHEVLREAEALYDNGTYRQLRSGLLPTIQ